MLYLGIDIGKNNHVASLLDDNAKPIFKALSFTNTTDGGNSLIEKLNTYIASATICLGYNNRYRKDEDMI